jgi:hypothetical protein
LPKLRKIWTIFFVHRKHRQKIQKFPTKKKLSAIHYTTGVHQYDNMSAILFLFVMEAFLETLKLNTQTIEYSFFPENKKMQI